MAISAVSSQSFSSSASTGGTTIAKLQKRLQELQKELRDEALSKTDDAKTKAEKEKELQLEIQEVQAEIQQEQAKAASKNTQKQGGSKSAPPEANQTAASQKSPSYNGLDQVA